MGGEISTSKKKRGGEDEENDANMAAEPFLLYEKDTDHLRRWCTTALWCIVIETVVVYGSVIVGMVYTNYVHRTSNDHLTGGYPPCDVGKISMPLVCVGFVTAIVWRIWEVVSDAAKASDHRDLLNTPYRLCSALHAATFVCCIALALLREYPTEKGGYVTMSIIQRTKVIMRLNVLSSYNWHCFQNVLFNLAVGSMAFGHSLLLTLKMELKTYHMAPRRNGTTQMRSVSNRRVTHAVLMLVWTIILYVPVDYIRYQSTEGWAYHHLEGWAYHHLSANPQDCDSLTEAMRAEKGHSVTFLFHDEVQHTYMEMERQEKHGVDFGLCAHVAKNTNNRADQLELIAAQQGRKNNGDNDHQKDVCLVCGQKSTQHHAMKIVKQAYAANVVGPRHSLKYVPPLVYAAVLLWLVSASKFDHPRENPVDPIRPYTWLLLGLCHTSVIFCTLIGSPLAESTRPFLTQKEHSWNTLCFLGVVVCHVAFVAYRVVETFVNAMKKSVSATGWFFLQFTKHVSSGSIMFVGAWILLKNPDWVNVISKLL